MKPAAFAYRRVATVEEAVDLLGEHGPDARILAGGQSLVPMMNLRMARPTMLIDINRVSTLAGWRRDGGWVRAGAMLRQRSLERDRELAATAPLLSQAVRHIGHVATRSRGTLGGSLCHADPAAELPVCALALDAMIIVRSRHRSRQIAASDFFQGVFTTALADDEMVEAVAWPVSERNEAVAFVEVARRPGDFAIVAVASRLRLGADARVSQARIALGGVGETALRVRSAEAVIEGERPSAAAFREAGALAAEAISPGDDLHATSVYRRDLAAVLVQRALDAAGRNLSRTARLT